MDGGAWWARVCGIVQSQTQLKQLTTMCQELCGVFQIYHLHAYVC